MSTEKYQLLHNSRFYILAFAVLLSLAAVAYFRLTLVDDQVYAIRLQQLFGLCSVVCLYVAMIISPLGHAIGKQRVEKLAFMRRAIGVSAFYFAALHGIIVVFWQFGGLQQLTYLPTIFLWSLLCAMVTFVVLSLLAATSFDRTIRYMTFRRWKWLHRLIYIGAIMCLLHIWTVGTHLAHGGVQLALFIAIVVLLGLELWRICMLLGRKGYLGSGKMDLLVTWLVGFTILSLVVFTAPHYVTNYHSRHHHVHSTANGEVAI